MQICVVGAGYVGLTTAAALANDGHQVVCVDIDREKIDLLKRGEIPIYEPGLKERVEANTEAQRLSFSSRIEEHLLESQVVLIAVGTPPLNDGRTDLSQINHVVDCLIRSMNEYKLIVIKSTVPLGTSERIDRVFQEAGIHKDLYDIVFNPEFLKEGTALWDIENPSRIVFGLKSERPKPLLLKLFKKDSVPVIYTSLTGAELIKYASNYFLGLKISYANEMAKICDAYQVNYTHVQEGIGTDPRIGREFLHAGLGYGGSCLPKDIQSLKHCAAEKNVETPILDAVLKTNFEQIEYCINKLSKALKGLDKKKIAVWGVTFKPNTDDTRFSPAIRLIEELVKRGSTVHSYDPMVCLQDRKVISFTDLYESIDQVDALVIATEWSEFKECDLALVKRKMKGTTILDARNCLDQEKVKNIGLAYIGVGQS